MLANVVAYLAIVVLMVGCNGKQAPADDQSGIDDTDSAMVTSANTEQGLVSQPGLG